MERIIACHGPALHPGTCLSPFLLSSSSLYLTFFQLTPIALCLVHDGLEPTGLFLFAVVPGDRLFACSLPYMK